MKNIVFDKKMISRIIIGVLLVALVGVGIYGTVLGIKDTVKQKQHQEDTTEATTQEFPIKGAEKVFEYGDMKITLTEDFQVLEEEGEPYGYAAQGIKIYIDEETNGEFPENKGLTLEEYAKKMVELNKRKVEEIVYEDNYCHVTYLFGGSGIVERYTVCMYEGVDGFWIVHFITSNKSAQAYKSHIMKWADSVVIG